MELTGEHLFHAPRDAVYAALLDAALLRQAIPGAHLVERDGPGAFRIAASLKIGQRRRDFTARGELYNVDPPSGFSLVLTVAEATDDTAEASGAAKLSATAHLALALEGPDRTTLAFHIETEADSSSGSTVREQGERLAAEFLSRLALLIDVEPLVPLAARAGETAAAQGAATHDHPQERLHAFPDPSPDALPQPNESDGDAAPNLVKLSDRQWASAQAKLTEQSALYDPTRTHVLFPPQKKPNEVRRWLTVGVGVLVILGLLVDRF